MIKIKNGTTVFFISKNFISPKSVVNMYRIRWNIEIFHRTAKQKFGIGDCQMRSIEKQRQHVLAVMHAYTIADIYRYKFNFKNTEEAIKYIRLVKSKDLMMPILSVGGNLC